MNSWTGWQRRARRTGRSCLLGLRATGILPISLFLLLPGIPIISIWNTLKEEGLLTEEECREADCGENPRSVDYGRIYETRFKVLRKAFSRFQEDEGYRRFGEENAFWLEDYCLYMAVKGSQAQNSWLKWPEALKKRHPEALEQAAAELEEEIRFYRFQQYCFDRQWKKLKQYANDRGIRVIGDIPHLCGPGQRGCLG